MADAPFTEVLTNNIATESKFAFRNATGTPLVVPFVPNTAPPAVANFDPAVAAAMSKTQAISFDVTDDQNLFRRIIVFVQFPSLEIYDVAYDGTAFGQRYSSQFNSKIAITNGFRFTLLRDEGWPSSPRIVPIAIDLAGNENPVESQTYAWTLV